MGLMKPLSASLFVLHFSSILVEVFNLIEILFDFASETLKNVQTMASNASG